MGFWKFSPLLILGILALYQVGMLQAAPFRSALESPQDTAMLNEEELRLLLAAMVKDFVQRKASELQQEQETEGSSGCLAPQMGGEQEEQARRESRRKRWGAALCFP
ncbi:calcitonin receptor-stimulating peptide 1-like isoform X2 [Prionailurus bengalensis]|uniref:calcitonin receptor-stimulating peptide 1-like isoform X2 n=1 Tax=Prionailurus bengalensis TaxID=37029 RepID=UPI001CA8D52E|nr:calcitonin receptor-stimulating peptide 1-like isoform X2 [Prionailurus bengalensis]